MRKILAAMLLTWLTTAPVQTERAQQVWTGRLSDSMCGASHHPKAEAGKMSERECIFECIKGLAKYILVDEKQQVIAIANQDFGGFPLYAGRIVKITGELKDGAILATKVEPVPGQP
jgi:hypothetical protein